MPMSKKVYFISGIDTDSGKTFATGLIAKSLLDQGKSVITQKIAQTGCTDISIDILKHRELMGVDLFAEDISKITCPYCFSIPASPHLAAKLEGKKIDVDIINKNTSILLSKFDYVLLEGAGGLLVPINDELFTIDFIKQQNYPLILVTSAKIGSINHTLLSIEACKNRGIELAGIVFNEFPKVLEVIRNDSREIIKKQLHNNYPHAFFIDIPFISGTFTEKLHFTI
jgi:dethiobiotin synthetase